VNAAAPSPTTRADCDPCEIAVVLLLVGCGLREDQRGNDGEGIDLPSEQPRLVGHDMPLVSQPQINHGNDCIARGATNPARCFMTDRGVVGHDRDLGEHRLTEIALRREVIEERKLHIVLLVLHRIPQCLPRCGNRPL